MGKGTVILSSTVVIFDTVLFSATVLVFSTVALFRMQLLRKPPVPCRMRYEPPLIALDNDKMAPATEPVHQFFSRALSLVS